MPNETLARRYAQAVFNLATERGVVAETGSDLNKLWKAVSTDDGIKSFFFAPIVERGEKQKVLAKSFAGQTGELALHTVLLLVRKRRERLLPELIEQYEALDQAARGAEPLTITSAHELSQTELDQLVGRLSKLYGKRFEVHQRVDGSLLGGIRIRMGDVAVDGTVSGKLDEFSRALLAPKQ